MGHEVRSLRQLHVLICTRYRFNGTCIFGNGVKLSELSSGKMTQLIFISSDSPTNVIISTTAGVLHKTDLVLCLESSWRGSMNRHVVILSTHILIYTRSTPFFPIFMPFFVRFEDFLG